MAGSPVTLVVLVELDEVEGGLVVLDSSEVTCPPTTPQVRAALEQSPVTVI